MIVALISAGHFSQLLFFFGPYCLLLRYLNSANPSESTKDSAYTNTKTSSVRKTLAITVPPEKDL